MVWGGSHIRVSSQGLPELLCPLSGGTCSNDSMCALPSLSITSEEAHRIAPQVTIPRVVMRSAVLVGKSRGGTHTSSFHHFSFCAHKRAGPDFGHYPSIRPVVSASFPHLAGLVSSRGSRVLVPHLVFVHHCLSIPFVGCSPACRHLLTQAHSSPHRILISRGTRAVSWLMGSLSCHISCSALFVHHLPEPPIPWMLHVLRVV